MKNLTTNTDAGFIAIDSDQGIIWGVGTTLDQLEADVREWLPEASQYEEDAEVKPFFAWLEETHRVKYYFATPGAVTAVKAKGADADIERNENPDYAWLETEEEPGTM